MPRFVPAFIVATLVSTLATLAYIDAMAPNAYGRSMSYGVMMFMVPVATGLFAAGLAIAKRVVEKSGFPFAVPYMLAGAFFPALLFFVTTCGPAFGTHGYGKVSWLEAVIRHLYDPLMFASAMVPGGLVGGLILYSGARRKKAVVPPGR